MWFNQVRKKALLPLLFGFVFLTILGCSRQSGVDEFVEEAWSLRVNGQLDSAEIRLQEILASDSSNALAWFELGRTFQHRGLNKPRFLIDSIGKMIEAVDRAYQLDPSRDYYLYYKGKLETLDTYHSIKLGKGDGKEKLQKMLATYSDLLKKNTKYQKAKISIVEFLAYAGEENGGDLKLADSIITDMQAFNSSAWALARELTMPGESDFKGYWKKIVEENPDNADLLEAQGWVYLFDMDVENARTTFKKAMDMDPSKNYLYLHIARYYMFRINQERHNVDIIAPQVEAELNNFLESTPEPNNPMKAWTYGYLGRMRYAVQDQEGGNRYMDMAKESDPYHAHSYKLPDPAIFIAPDKELINHEYYFRPL